jgi:hypothetical protein
MSDRPDTDDSDTMRDEYDFTGGVRGKYAARVAQGTNIVKLGPVRKCYPGSQRIVMTITQAARKDSARLS